jgi:transcriptional regulator with XRE-family HTH domain
MKETFMIIGERLRQLREFKKRSQGDIEKRTGLLRCYISRVENGHTVPSIETLEKFARALEVPTYQLFYEGDVPKEAKARASKKPVVDGWLNSGRTAAYFLKLRRHLSKMSVEDRKLLARILQLMIAKHGRTISDRQQP